MYPPSRNQTHSLGMWVCALTGNWTWTRNFGLWAEAPTNWATPARAHGLVFLGQNQTPWVSQVPLTSVLYLLTLIWTDCSSSLYHSCHPNFSALLIYIRHFLALTSSSVFYLCLLECIPRKCPMEGCMKSLCLSDNFFFPCLLFFLFNFTLDWYFGRVKNYRLTTL